MHWAANVQQLTGCSITFSQEFASNRKGTYHVAMSDALELSNDKEPQPKRASASDPVRLRKPHEMVVMVPRTKRVTLTGRRIYNVLLQIGQRRLVALDRMPAADEIPFEAPLSAILRTSGSSVEDRTVAKRYLREMRSLEVDWESTAPGDGIKYRGFNMLAEVVLEQRNGENWVRWAFPPTIMGALKDPHRWATLDLDMVAKLGTYVATALYDICARYRDNPSGLTSRKPVEWWTDALSPAPAGSERREWRKFKNERIKEAVEEINQVTDLEVELVEHKQGRVIVEAQFSVRKKAGAGRNVFESTVVDANLVHRAEMLGIPESKLDRLIQEFGEAQVRENVDILERRVVNRELRGLENPYAWIRSVLRNNLDGAPIAPSTLMSPASAQQVAAPRSSQSTSLLTKAKGVAVVPSTAVPSLPPAPAFTGSPEYAKRLAELRNAFERLESGERTYWAQRVLNDPKNTNMFGAVIKKRVLGGDILHGLFGDTLIRTWAENAFGPDWASPNANPGQGSLIA